jgi:hypothetical protein
VTALAQELRPVEKAANRRGGRAERLIAATKEPIRTLLYEKPAGESIAELARPVFEFAQPLQREPEPGDGHDIRF